MGLGKGEMRMPGCQCCRDVTNTGTTGESPFTTTVCIKEMQVSPRLVNSTTVKMGHDLPAGPQGKRIKRHGEGNCLWCIQFGNSALDLS